MLKRSRFFISATLVAVLFSSLLLLSNPDRARACPVMPPPATLLALYLRSDLVVVAEIADEKDGKITDDNENYYYVDVVRRLKVSSTLKGKPSAESAFVKSEFRGKTVEPPAPESEEVEEESFAYAPYGYKGVWELQAGERYLFFLTRDSESGEYGLTDDVSGARRLADYDLAVHTARLKELQSIVKMKKNQAAALIGWLVRCAEEPATRWDGVFDLNNSFGALEDADEIKAENAFRLDRDFSSRTPEIAQSLSDAQKAKLSNIAFGLLQQNDSFLQTDDIYYGLTGLVKNWDKARLAMYAFSRLESMDKSDSEKTGAALNYISEIIGDEDLTEISGRFLNAEAEPETDAEPETADESDEEKPAPSVDAVMPENAAPNPDEASLKTPPAAEGKSVIIDDGAERASPEEKKPSPEEIRAKILREFVDRYQYLVANGFQIEQEPAEATAPAETEK